MHAGPSRTGWCEPRWPRAARWIPGEACPDGVELPRAIHDLGHLEHLRHGRDAEGTPRFGNVQPIFTAEFPSRDVHVFHTTRPSAHEAEPRTVQAPGRQCRPGGRCRVRSRTQRHLIGTLAPRLEIAPRHARLVA